MLIQENKTPWNKKSGILIHGIGRQPEKFSVPMQKLLREVDPATADATRWYEVAYDSVNDAMEQKVIEFRSALAKPDGGTDVGSLAADFLADLINFLFNVDPYNWINTITTTALTEVVEDGQKAGVEQKEHEVFILSHSLGTVVAYETLHTIINEPQTLGLSSNFRVKTLFTLGSPLAFIKANTRRIPTVNDNFYLRNEAIGKPMRNNSFTGRMQSNVTEWYNLRQKIDPVASLIPLDQASANGSLATETMVFDKLHTGVNPHDFMNYLTEFGPMIMEKVRA